MLLYPIDVPGERQLSVCTRIAYGRGFCNRANALISLYRLREKLMFLKGTAYLVAASIRPYVSVCNEFGFSR